MECLHMPKWTRNKTISHYYKTFQFKKDKNHPYYMSKKQYRHFIETYLLLLDEYLMTGKGYKPPYGLGEFKIVKYKPIFTETKPRNYAIERAHYKATGKWKKAFIHNLHTNGERATVRWYTTGYKQIPNRRIYKFTSARTLRTKLGEMLSTKGNIQDFYNVQKVTRLRNQQPLI